MGMGNRIQGGEAMRKQSAYARKIQRKPYYNGAMFLNVIQRCRPYTDDPIVGTSIEGNQSAATKAMIMVRDAFQSIKAGTSPKNECRDFDILAHAFGVTTLRSIDIAGQDPCLNPMLPICRAGNDALERCRVRRNRFEKWEFDKPAVAEVDAAIELYETILQSSSPAQMEEATVRRIEILEMARKEQV
jgi:hypothetical protein